MSALARQSRSATADAEKTKSPTVSEEFLHLRCIFGETRRDLAILRGIHSHNVPHRSRLIGQVRVSYARFRAPRGWCKCTRIIPPLPLLARPFVISFHRSVPIRCRDVNVSALSHVSAISRSRSMLCIVTDYAGTITILRRRISARCHYR